LNRGYDERHIQRFRLGRRWNVNRQIVNFLQFQTIIAVAIGDETFVFHRLAPHNGVERVVVRLRLLLLRRPLLLGLATALFLSITCTESESK
jgi:hypothetical protein